MRVLGEKMGGLVNRYTNLRLERTAVLEAQTHALSFQVWTKMV